MLNIARAGFGKLLTFFGVRSSLCFQHYRVAPRLGMANVRRRLLLGINTHESVATQTQTEA
jgi:hypothetical protein